MPGCWRIADVSAGGIIAMFVLKDAVENDELFATAMGVGRKQTSGCVTDDGGGACHLPANPIQHPAINIGGGRWNPRADSILKCDL